MRILRNVMTSGMPPFLRWPSPPTMSRTARATTSKAESYAYQQSKSSSSEGLLPTVVRTISPRRRVPKALTARKLACLLGLVIVGIPFLAAFLTSLGPWRLPGRRNHPDREHIFSDAQEPGGSHRFVIVVPAEGPSPDLCKLVTSAIALGYPAPVIVNWDETTSPNREPAASGVDRAEQSAYSRVSSVLRYLDQATRYNAHAADELESTDLVLVLEQTDSWFQLPPEVLLGRYHESNREATARLSEQWGGERDMPMQQTILMSLQQPCYTPSEGGHADKSELLSCRGDDGVTRMSREDKDGRVIQPMDGGSSIIGPAGDMRRFLRRVKEKMESRSSSSGGAKASMGEDGVVAEVFREQEVWRQWRRQWRADAGTGTATGGQASPTGGPTTSQGTDAPDQQLEPEELQRAEPTKDFATPGLGLIQSDFEFHVGLDYGMGLFLPSLHPEAEGSFLHLGNETEVEREARHRGTWPRRMTGVPEDVEQTKNPIAKLVKGSIEWGDMSLYTDLQTLSAPAVVHGSDQAHRAGTDDTWDKTWFFPYLRPLVTRHISSGARRTRAMATLPSGKTSYVRYWPVKSETRSRKPRRFEGASEGLVRRMEEMELDAVCRVPGEGEDGEMHWYHDIFRDGKGAL